VLVLSHASCFWVVKLFCVRAAVYRSGVIDVAIGFGTDAFGRSGLTHRPIRCGPAAASRRLRQNRSGRNPAGLLLDQATRRVRFRNSRSGRLPRRRGSRYLQGHLFHGNHPHLLPPEPRTSGRNNSSSPLALISYREASIVPQFSRGKALAAKPDNVRFGKVDEQAAPILPEGHAGVGEFDEKGVFVEVPGTTVTAPGSRPRGGR
jgi:hypothetical protein